MFISPALFIQPKVERPVMPVLQLPLGDRAQARALINVLLVEDDAIQARQIQQALAAPSDSLFHVEWVTRLGGALVRLRAQEIDVVLLDLTLPDGHGVADIDRILQLAPQVLILALCTTANENSARDALDHGAHDYLAKDRIDPYWWPRALRYSLDCKAAKEARSKSEARFQAFSEASPLGIFVSDAQGRCIYCNSAYQAISGFTLEQTLGTHWSKAIHPDDRQRVLVQWLSALRSNTAFQAELRFLRRDGSEVWTRLNTAALLDVPGNNTSLQGYVQLVEDISARKSTELVLQRAEEELFAEKERVQVTLNSIGDAVLCTDLAGKVTYLNSVAETMTGWACADAIGRPLDEVFHIVDGDNRLVAAANPARRAIDEDRVVGLSADCVLIRRDGVESPIEDSAAPIHNRDGAVAGAVIVFRDVSQSRVMAMKMTYLATHDFLTGLPNRALLSERLSQALAMARRHRKQGALLFLDLDFFKHINDSLGHVAGDQLLLSAAARLQATVRGTDTVCRQGGDEFVILLTEIEQPQDAAQVAEKLLAAFTEPHLIGGHELHLTVSIGISVYPDDGTDVDTIMQNADTAMYHAKASGRNNYQFFRSEMNTHAVQRLLVQGNLRRALRSDEFVLHYQPQIALASGRMTGAEVLLRWADPANGLVYPNQFMEVAEDSGLIVPIGRWVLREACRQVKAWIDAGLDAVPVAVNISAVEFRQQHFLDDVAQILKDTGLDPKYLELELTESVLMDDAESSMAVLDSLNTLGVRLAIDDFGTGYSSLNYLKRFPISTLKIDQSFVQDITLDGNDATIVSAVIGMGRNLKQRVIAEGVETAEQLAFLRTRSCDEAQGFHFSHALPAPDFARLLGR